MPEARRNVTGQIDNNFLPQCRSNNVYLLFLELGLSKIQGYPTENSELRLPYIQAAPGVPMPLPERSRTIRSMTASRWLSTWILE
jgi:hypothetical protein